MAKRDFRKTSSDPFAEENNPAQVDSSWMEADQGIFGAIAAADAQTERIKTLDIFRIAPDPGQPRRVLPYAVRSQWDGDPNSVAALLVKWAEMVEAESGRPFPLAAYLLEIESEETERSQQPTALEITLLQVVDLATSIRRDGLANPVTVVADGPNFRLETGERRWLAYHLLHTFFDGHAEDVPDERDRWKQIPARQMPALDVWRQAGENNARQSLNAIGRARQFAILLMDLWQNDERSPRQFDPIHTFPNEQEYYAQVKSMSPPRGKSAQLLSAMGFKHRNAIQRHRDLLGLPGQLWRLADDYDCPEGVLRELVKLPEKEALEVFEIWRQSVTSGDISQAVDIPKDKKERPALPGDPALQRGDRLFSSQKARILQQYAKELSQLRDGVGQANGQTKSQIRQLVADLRHMMDAIEWHLDRQ